MIKRILYSPIYVDVIEMVKGHTHMYHSHNLRRPHCVVQRGYDGLTAIYSAHRHRVRQLQHEENHVTQQNVQKDAHYWLPLGA